MVDSNPFSAAKLVEGIVLFVYGFSGEDFSAKLKDGEAQSGMPVVCFKIQNEILVS